MAIFRQKKNRTEYSVPVLAGGGGRNANRLSLLSGYSSFDPISNELFRSLRESVPVIDAAIYKTVRLIGGFKIQTTDKRFDKVMEDFLKNVPADSGQISLQGFIDMYFDRLLTYGTAVAEMVTDEEGRVVYLYNAPQNSVVLKRNKTDFRKVDVCYSEDFGSEPLEFQDRLVFSTLNAEAGSLTGTSILRGLPFVSSVLLKIYNAIGENWDRVGNVRFAVTYKPKDDAMSGAYAKDRAMQIAEEWGSAMKSSEVRDFIAVGDVDIKVIGADNQILDSEVPVRQMLEQIIAKMAIPPFMLGLSWSTTERMSEQQADALTTELEHYRRVLTPVIEKICKTHLRAYGYTNEIEVVWDDIMLRDALEEANARHINAQADEIYSRLNGGEGGKNE